MSPPFERGIGAPVHSLVLPDSFSRGFAVALAVPNPLKGKTTVDGFDRFDGPKEGTTPNADAVVKLEACAPS